MATAGVFKSTEEVDNWFDTVVMSIYEIDQARARGEWPPKYVAQRHPLLKRLAPVYELPFVGSWIPGASLHDQKKMEEEFAERLARAEFNKTRRGKKATEDMYLRPLGGYRPTPEMQAWEARVRALPVVRR